jgi:predicted metal-binding protein
LTYRRDIIWLTWLSCSICIDMSLDLSDKLSYLVVEIDPDEAQAMIELVEMLFDEWYVARKQREDRLARVAAIVAGKQRPVQVSRFTGVRQPLLSLR